MKIGQIGLGYWGENIFRNLVHIHKQNKITQIVIFDIDHSKVENIVGKYKDQEISLSIARSIEDMYDCDAVVISTPASTHYSIAKKFILNNVHTFVEKPLSLNIEEAEELRKLSKQKGICLMVGHLLLYHPAINKIKQIIHQGEIGKIIYLFSNRLNWGKLRTEENILWSFAPHDISLILYILQEEPLKVEAFGISHITPNVFDITLTTLEFSQNIKAHIFVSWLNPYKEHKLTIVGSEGMLVFDDLTKEKLFFYPHKVEWKNGKVPMAKKEECKVVPVSTEEPLYLELNHFLDCIINKTEPLTNADEAIRVLRIIKKAEDCLKAGKFEKSSKIDLDHACINYRQEFYVHPSSYIDENVKIGRNTKIWHFCHILKNTEIGEGVIIGQNVMIGPDVKIGNRCKIQNNVSIYKGVELEDEVFCGPSCVFTNVYNPRAFIERKHEFRKTLVKRGATIGANATIVCGVTIGKFSFIGAGAVVNRDVPDYALVVGVPARQIGWVCKCGTTLKFENNYSKCTYCQNEYKLEQTKLIPIVEN
ncbi:MAG: Gfo/Idh/MocA family oxidoreductase [bacterium]